MESECKMMADEWKDGWLNGWLNGYIYFTDHIVAYSHYNFFLGKN